MLIETEQLYRYYGKHCAVNDVSFTLGKGEILGFLGPNGAGKSTTMRMICGNLAPSAGSIRINGIDMLDNPKEAKAALGYLPETPPVHHDMTVDEFLVFCARLHKIVNNRIRTSVENTKERCGLGQVGHRLIGNLSKGYQQRVGIAQAIVHMPAVIVLDEPTVGLDPIQIKEIRALIRELGKDHGVILSTHILPEVQESCTRVQIIHRGKLVFNDTIQNLEQHMRASSLVLVTQTAPSSDILQQIEGITSIEKMDSKKFRIFHNNAINPAKKLAEVTVSEGWGLLELTPESKSLEDVFVEITATTTKEAADK